MDTLRASRRRSQAAVLVAVFRDDALRLRLRLIRRTSYGRHGGQIALPGGNCEPEDLNDPSRTALREACEELGVAAPSFVLIDSLEPVETATTGYVVYPFLARFVAEPGCWHASSEETFQVRSVDVAALAAPSALGTAEMDFPTWSAPREVPVRRLGDVAVWGLTLRILEPLLPRLLAEEWVV